MSTYLNSLGQPGEARPGKAMARTAANPLGQAAQEAAAEGMQFQLWVAQQASALTKLKIFNSMAKSVNDQQ
ncbi:hypothetical protein IP92_05484 [Pseudoduganella flava]|uniref:Uncharacterized protein n=1 Tax=Pseudoduganella flava TaxID=871742 RepID=A0A562PDM8_9BURK|nr:hypothetical protein [Pseudoduganella flava]QGZ42121.1 hypothetical protein GO485_25805 [Pseudoduganella flava]TWI42508.1 hypothetical protein IP92_05484 [Pseudoduganella flava]